jgi:hypothetical protein
MARRFKTRKNDSASIFVLAYLRGIHFDFLVPIVLSLLLSCLVYCLVLSLASCPEGKINSNCLRPAFYLFCRVCLAQLLFLQKVKGKICLSSRRRRGQVGKSARNTVLVCLLAEGEDKGRQQERPRQTKINQDSISRGLVLYLSSPSLVLSFNCPLLLREESVRQSQDFLSSFWSYINV